MLNDRLFDPPGPAVTTAEAASRRAANLAAQGQLVDVAEKPRPACPACGSVTAGHVCAHEALTLPDEPLNVCDHCGATVEFGMTEHGFRGFVHLANRLTTCPTDTRR